MLENRIIIVMSHPYINRGLIKVCNIVVGPFKSCDGARKFLMMNEFKKQNTGKRREVWRGFYDEAFDWEWDAEIKTTEMPWVIEEKGL